MRVVRLGIKSINRSVFQGSVGAALLFVVLSGCTVVQGNTASLDNMKAAAVAPAPAVAADAMTTGSLAETSVASAGIPIPLISPRHEGIKVASIDPRSGLSALALNGGLPLNKMAGVYIRFDNAINGAEASKLNTPKEIRRILKTLRFKAPETLADGWYAVQAMAAAKDPAFSRGARDEVRKLGEAHFLAALNDPNYVLTLPGASSAMAAVMTSAKSEDERLIKLRKRFIETAFHFQKQKWGMITPLHVGPTTDMAQTEPVSKQIRQFFASLSPVSPAQAYSRSVMSKILAQGAREAISAPVISVSGTKDETSSCLNWARLNLNQCIAAAHFPSEEAWCVGTHAVEEVRTCWAAALPAGPN